MDHRVTPDDDIINHAFKFAGLRHEYSIAQSMLHDIQHEMNRVLLEYPVLHGLCVQGSSTLSMYLTNAGIENYVAIGSLKCGDIQEFEYEPIDWEAPDSNLWAGHAWCVIRNQFIADITLLKSVRELPTSTNLKNAIKNLNLQKYLLFLKHGNSTVYGSFTYTKEAILPTTKIPNAVAGLKAKNSIPLE